DLEAAAIEDVLHETRAAEPRQLRLATERDGDLVGELAARRHRLFVGDIALPEIPRAVQVLPLVALELGIGMLGSRNVASGVLRAGVGLERDERTSCAGGHHDRKRRRGECTTEDR